jgi:hypothetical protein
VSIISLESSSLENPRDLGIELGLQLLALWGRGCEREGVHVREVIASTCMVDEGIAETACLLVL